MNKLKMGIYNNNNNTKVKADLMSSPATSTRGLKEIREGRSSWPLATCLEEL